MTPYRVIFESPLELSAQGECVGLRPSPPPVGGVLEAAPLPQLPPERELRPRPFCPPHP